MTRALETVGGWDQITHVGSNSGGNWFASQLFYSSTFFGNLTDPSVDLAEFVTLWGTEYDAAMTAAVDSGAAWANTFDPGTFGPAHPLCAATADFVQGLAPILADRAFPTWVWLPCTYLMPQVCLEHHAPVLTLAWCFLRRQTWRRCSSPGSATSRRRPTAPGP
jgi:hypothetical protein